MYREIKPLIENTICEAREKEGKVISYRIRPEKGYKLHEITLDEKNEKTDEVILGFTNAYVTAGADYDFDNNYREIYAVKEKEDEWSDD